MSNRDPYSDFLLLLGRACGSMPGPHVLLSTLGRRSRERLRMTRSRCGSLIHHFYRVTFAFNTPRRFDRRTRS
jgi:hypothetical protein